MMFHFRNHRTAHWITLAGRNTGQSGVRQRVGATMASMPSAEAVSTPSSVRTHAGANGGGSSTSTSAVTGVVSVTADAQAPASMSPQVVQEAAAAASVFAAQNVLQQQQQQQQQLQQAPPQQQMLQQQLYTAPPYMPPMMSYPQQQQQQQQYQQMLAQPQQMAVHSPYGQYNRGSNDPAAYDRETASWWRRCWGTCGITPSWWCFAILLCMVVVTALLIGGVIWWSISSWQIDNLQDDIDSINSELSTRYGCLSCSSHGNLTVTGSMNVDGQLGAASAVFGLPLPPLTKRKRFAGTYVPDQFALKLANDQHMQPGTALWATNETVGQWFDVIQTTLNAWELLQFQQLQLDAQTALIIALQSTVSALQSQMSGLNSSVVALQNSVAVLNSALANEILTRQQQDALRMRYMGYYSAVVQYVPNDVVTYTNDSTWIALLNSTGVAPTGPPNWQVFSSGNGSTTTTIVEPAGFGEGLSLQLSSTTPAITDSTPVQLVFNETGGTYNFDNLTVAADGSVVIPTNGRYLVSFDIMIQSVTGTDNVTFWNTSIVTLNNASVTEFFGPVTYGYVPLTPGGQTVYYMSFTQVVQVTYAPQTWQIWTQLQVGVGSSFQFANGPYMNNILSIQRVD